MSIITFDPKYGRYLRVIDMWAKMTNRPADSFTPSELKDIMPYYLQLEGTVNKTGKTTLQTQKGNMNVDNPDAKLLDKNDIFIATGYALGIRRFDPATKSYSAEPIFTHPSKLYFDGTLSGKTAESKALRSIFGGSHTVKSGTTVLVEERSNLPFLKVPNAPYTADYDAEFSVDENLVHFPKLDVYFGSQNYEITINYGTCADWDIADGSTTSAGANRSTRNQLVWIMEGVRIVGGAAAKLQID